MRTKALALLIATTVWGCSDATRTPAEAEQQQDDHPAFVLEAEQVAEALDSTLASRVFTAAEPFVRLGLLWDAPRAGALELRTSLDGSAWTDWQPLVETFAEAPMFSGHLDVAGVAQHFQYRVADAEAMPTWLNVIPLEEIPEEIGEASAETEPTLPDAEEATEQDRSLTIHSRASWGARAPRCWSATVPNRVTIHHTVTPTNDSMTPQARLRQIQAFHMDSMGWCDIGYNFLMSRDGRVWRGRGRLRLGAHVANNNSGNVGLSFMGTYSNVKANSAQRCAAAAMPRWLHAKEPAIKLNRDDVKGHRQYGATACPGDALYGQLNGIVELARNGGCP